MCRIHPDVCSKSPKPPRETSEEGQHDRQQCPSKFTVWKRSSMSFQGMDGFTVFDECGGLVFRVDNYSRNNGCTGGGGEALVLMDGAGSALLTFRPKVTDGC